MNQYLNPYQNFQQPNTLPSQQILQANGMDSVKQIRLMPNSSVLVADATLPIVYRCISDGVGVVNVEAFDIVPHKSEAEIEQQTLMATISDMNARLSKLEEINNGKSTTSRNKSRNNTESESN